MFTKFPSAAKQSDQCGYRIDLFVICLASRLLRSAKAFFLMSHSWYLAGCLACRRCAVNAVCIHQGTVVKFPKLKIRTYGLAKHFFSY